MPAPINFTFGNGFYAPVSLGQFRRSAAERRASPLERRGRRGSTCRDAPDEYYLPPAPASRRFIGADFAGAGARDDMI